MLPFIHLRCFEDPLDADVQGHAQPVSDLPVLSRLGITGCLSGVGNSLKLAFLRRFVRDRFTRQ